MKAVNILRASLVAGLALGGMSQAFALTAAGLTVTNTATVDYVVGGINQADVSSTPASFTVDRVIDVTVAADNSPLAVIPGTNGYVLKFTVTNQSNDTLDFGLSVLEADGTAIPGVGTDNVNMATFAYFVDSNDNGVYDAALDTATTINNLAAADTITVFAVANAQSGTDLDGKIAGVTVVATALNDDSTAIVALTDADANTPGEDTVFGDTVGANSVLSDDADYDGKGSAYGAYEFATANLEFSKTATIIDDPVNGTSNPKAIPGATIEYCLVISNTGSADADSIVLTDHIPANTTYVGGSLKIGMAAGTTATSCDGTGGNDPGTPTTSVTTSGGTNSKGTVTLQVGTLADTTGVFRALFRVTVD